MFKKLISAAVIIIIWFRSYFRETKKMGNNCQCMNWINKAKAIVTLFYQSTVRASYVRTVWNQEVSISTLFKSKGGQIPRVFWDLSLRLREVREEIAVPLKIFIFSLVSDEVLVDWRVGFFFLLWNHDCLVRVGQWILAAWILVRYLLMSLMVGWSSKLRYVGFAVT